jgi:tRNA A-37 threonylcarbamoyl transferase component Bud32
VASTTHGSAIEWRAGDARLFEALEPLLLDLAGGRRSQALAILRDKPGRRRLGRGELPSGEVCFLKLYQGDGRRRARRQVMQRLLGLTTPAREFATLRRLRAAGVAVPEPLAYARLAGSQEVVVTRYLDGLPLTRALEVPRRERVALLRAVGELVARLHATGTVHRDLHGENVWVTREGPVLIDLQAAWRAWAPWLRRRDRGELDRSIASSLSLPDRMHLRAALLGAKRPFSRSARRRLRDVGAASHERSRAHAESRTRRSLSPGRLFTRWHGAAANGLRLRSADEARLMRALAGAPEGDLEVLHFPASRLRWLPGQGSLARRGWRAGHGLAARGIPARKPLAFLERGGWLGGGESWLVLERAASSPPGDAPAVSPDELRVLGLALTRFGIQHEHIDAVPLCRNLAGALCVDQLQGVRLAHRRSARALRAIDAFVAARIAAAPAPPEERDAAHRRYLRERRFLPGGGGGGGGRGRPRRQLAPQPQQAASGHGAGPAAQPPSRRRAPSNDASSPPHLEASRGSSSQT